MQISQKSKVNQPYQAHQSWQSKSLDNICKLDTKGKVPLQESFTREKFIEVPIEIQDYKAAYTYICILQIYTNIYIYIYKNIQRWGGIFSKNPK